MAGLCLGRCGANRGFWLLGPSWGRRGLRWGLRWGLWGLVLAPPRERHPATIPFLLSKVLPDPGDLALLLVRANPSFQTLPTPLSPQPLGPRAFLRLPEN